MVSNLPILGTRACLVKSCTLEPHLSSAEFLRIYHDRFHESFTLYRIDIDAGDAQPIVDVPNHFLSDVLAGAEDEEGAIGDTVLEERSVELDDFNCLQRE
jgi:hypothetical protein